MPKFQIKSGALLLSLALLLLPGAPLLAQKVKARPNTMAIATTAAIWRPVRPTPGRRGANWSGPVINGSLIPTPRLVGRGTARQTERLDDITRGRFDYRPEIDRQKGAAGRVWPRRPKPHNARPLRGFRRYNS